MVTCLWTASTTVLACWAMTVCGTRSTLETGTATAAVPTLTPPTPRPNPAPRTLPPAAATTLAPAALSPFPAASLTAREFPLAAKPESPNLPEPETLYPLAPRAPLYPDASL